MAILKPVVAVMDETDSGLDIDALRTVAEAVNAMRGPTSACSSSPTTSASSATSRPTSSTSCSTAGSSSRAAPELAAQLEQKGYDWVRERHEAKAEA